jgi:hypothetical protein
MPTLVSVPTIPPLDEFDNIGLRVRIHWPEDYRARCACNHRRRRFAVDIETLMQLRITVAQRTSLHIRDHFRHFAKLLHFRADRSTRPLLFSGPKIAQEIKIDSGDVSVFSRQVFSNADISEP